MTNKYSELSDFEINKLIAESRNGRKIDRDIERDIFVPKICTTYHDAMQLMIDDEISLNKHGKKWRASKMFLINGKLEWRNIKSFIVIHENPCRAIAECYLLMKEDENNNEK